MTVPVMLSGSAPATTTCSPLGAAAVHRLQLLDRLGQRVLLTGEPGHEAAAECERRAPRAGASAHTTSRQGTLNDSRPHSSQATTPQRASSCQATASASSSLPGDSTPSSTRRRAEHLGPGQERPPALADAASRPARGGGPDRPDGRRTVRVRQRSRAESSDRTAEKASAVTMPRATRSHRPSSTSAGSRPVSGASSGRKQAPRTRSAASTSAAAPTSGSGATAPARTARSIFVEVVAHDEGQRGGRRRRAAAPGPLGPRGQAPPDHLTRQAELVEPAGVVAVDPGRQDLRLPLRRRRLDALQLLEHLQQPGPALEPAVGRGVLPVREEAHELGDGHRRRPGRGAGCGWRRAGAPEVAGAPAAVG